MAHLRSLRMAALAAGLGALSIPCVSLPAAAADLVRHALPNSHFPIAQAVEVPPGYTTVYLSGMAAQPLDKNAKPTAVEGFGDTETQARSALGQIETALKSLGLTFGDVVQMHVFMKADPKLGKMDFAGMMKAYKEKFGTASQPNLPVRSAFEVAGLANPGLLVEIEVIAVRKAS